MLSRIASHDVWGADKHPIPVDLNAKVTNIRMLAEQFAMHFQPSISATRPMLDPYAKGLKLCIRWRSFQSTIHVASLKRRAFILNATTRMMPADRLIAAPVKSLLMT